MNCIKNAWQNIFPFFLRGIVAVLFYPWKSLQKQFGYPLHAAILALSCTFKRKLAPLHCIPYGKPQRLVFSWTTRWKWTQTIDLYPTAFRKWFFSAGTELVGLISIYPSYTSGFMCGLWKMNGRYFYLNHTEILSCSNTGTKAAPRQTWAGSALPTAAPSGTA